MLPWYGTNGTSGTDDDGLGVRVRQTWRIALLGVRMMMGMRGRVGMGMRRRR